jgi:hypothetical protein
MIDIQRFLPNVLHKSVVLQQQPIEHIMNNQIYYYTFLDVSMDYYTSINTNFIELTHKYTYFVLVSGQKDDTSYKQYLSSLLGPKTIFIESQQNSMAHKFNLLKQYLEQHKAEYIDTIFCKIDTDLVHYRTEEFQSQMRQIFTKNKNVLVGVNNNTHIRGGLNAVHVDSILNCPVWPKDYHPFEFDMKFTDLLLKNKIKKYYFDTFNQTQVLDVSCFATHVVNQRLNNKKVDQLMNLLNQLKSLSVVI